MRCTFSPAAVVLAALASCLPRVPVHPMAAEYNNRCVALLNEGKLDDAEIACDHALSFSPEFAEPWGNKGVIEVQRGHDDAARAHLIKAIRLNNELAQAYITLGVLELRQHHAPRARELFERALKVNPDSLEARYDLALSWIASGRRDEARREYRTLLLINPNLADPHHDLGILALEDHDLDGAVAELEKAVLLDPRRSVAWLNLGFAYTQAARYADAQRAFVSCLDTDPDNLACRRAVALVARAAAAQEPLLQDAVEAEGLHARGLRQLEKGAVEAAERSFRACAEADPACRYSLHQLLETQGEKSAAATECAAFLRAAARDLFTAEVDHCEREVSRLSP